ncbi:MAG: ABC transporter ATP-binding protein [Clostridiales bacterium]|nr:ABC transporter ATP-binding protein [Clostridiales bacterium]
MAILTADHVEYTYQTKYQTVYALRGVDCAFETGQMTAIVGTSGSGKTTLLSLLAGLDVPTVGSINFRGQSTAELDRDAWRLENVSVIYQNFNLFAHLTALENAAYPLYLQKRPKKQAEEEAAAQLAAVGIRPDQFGRYPRMLSGGEQQRVAIARALAAGSGLILADEPTGNLDEENSRNIFAILRDLAHERERCVVVVTHDMALAEQTDRVLRIQDGRIAGEI